MKEKKPKELALKNESSKTYKYVFGPAFSRRLRRSLGIDPFQKKICTLNCIYCQLGETSKIQLDLVQGAPKELILQEVEDILNPKNNSAKSCPKPDYITFVGQGEPTLYKELGELTLLLKEKFSIPIALITNGTLLGQEEVAKAAALAEVVLPSLDAWDEDSFQSINRPCPGLSFDYFWQGLKHFAQSYNGKLWLEIMLIKGYNDSELALEKLAGLAKILKPDKIHLNSPVRPPSQAKIEPPVWQDLLKYAEIFEPKAEVISELVELSDLSSYPNEDLEEAIISLVSRHPAHLEGIAAGLKIKIEILQKALDRLVEQNRIKVIWHQGCKFYLGKN